LESENMSEQRDQVRAGIRKAEVFYVAKRPIEAEVTYVSKRRTEGRNLELIPLASRTVNRHEIQEVVFVDQDAIGPGSTVRDAAYLGFIEILRGNKLQTGDDLFIEGRYVGTVAGFDLSHYPNHFNIVVRTLERRSGAELGIRLGDHVRFVPSLGR
jgi:uncharacterized protein YuzE